MKTESFRCQLNHITKTLLVMTPAQRLTLQNIIQVSQPDITINELSHLFSMHHLNAHIALIDLIDMAHILLSGEKRARYSAINALLAIRPSIIKRKHL